MNCCIIEYTLPPRTRETLEALLTKMAERPESYGNRLVGLSAAQRHGRNRVRLHCDGFLLDEMVLEQPRWDAHEWVLDVTLGADRRWAPLPTATNLIAEVDSSSRLLYATAYVDSVEVCLNRLEQSFLDTTGQQTYMKDYYHATLQDLPGIAGVCYVRHAELFKTLSSYVSHYTLWWEPHHLYIVDIGYPYRLKSLGNFMLDCFGLTLAIRVEAPWFALAAEALRDSPVIEVGFPRGTKQVLRSSSCGLRLRGLTGPHISVFIPGVVANQADAPWSYSDIADGTAH